MIDSDSVRIKNEIQDFSKLSIDSTSNKCWVWWNMMSLGYLKKIRAEFKRQHLRSRFTHLAMSPKDSSNIYTRNNYAYWSEKIDLTLFNKNLERKKNIKQTNTWIKWIKIIRCYKSQHVATPSLSCFKIIPNHWSQ